MKKTLLSILSAAGIAAASVAMTGSAQAADAKVVVPRADGESYVAQPSETQGKTVDAVLVEDSAVSGEPNAVVVTPDGSRIATTVDFREDGTMVVPLDGRALNPAVSVEPSGYSDYSHQVYRVYDCKTIESHFEWDACIGPPPA